MEAFKLQNPSRRDVLRAAGGAVTAGLIIPSLAMPRPRESPQRLKISVFSKHLQFLDWQGLADTAAEIGFDGIDLTVRSGGHVLPERVEIDLPKAAEIIRKAGLSLPMVTAGIVDTRSPYLEPMLRTFGGLGISRYRWGGYQWSGSKSMPERMEELKQESARLAELNRKYQVCAMYHTHSGSEVGASIWDLWYILKDLDHDWLGINYDVSHATIEGGLGGWIASLRLVATILKGIAVKDFRWTRNASGEWNVEWCPLGEGMVNFKRFFGMIREARFAGPLQMHFEYPLGGVENGARSIRIDRTQVVTAMRRDLLRLKEWLREAGLA